MKLMVQPDAGMHISAATASGTAQRTEAVRAPIRFIWIIVLSLWSLVGLRSAGPTRLARKCAIPANLALAVNES